MGNEGALAMLTALGGNHNLTSLSISDNSIEPSLAEPLSDLIKTLLRLDASNNSLGTAGSTVMVKGLTLNPKLRMLNLENNEIDETGLENLIDGLRSNTHLEELILSGNEFGDRAAVALGSVLQQNSTLRRVYIDGECSSSNHSF